MKRRDFIRAVTTLPLAGSLSALAGPIDRDDDDKRGSTLAVFLHGPFAVILNAEKQLRLTAYVPFDPQKEHYFAFQAVQKYLANENSPQKVSYEFSAGDDFPGAPELPYIDHGFDDFTVRAPNWKKDPASYFVSLDLPMPNVITYIPPAEGVEFVNRTTGMMPIQHILEYKVRDWTNVRLHCNQKLPEGELKPMSFEQLYKEFKELWQTEGYRRMRPRATQQKDVENFLAHSAERKMGGYFFGVGLPHGSSDDTRKSHAIRFFNKVLLPSLGRTPDAENKQLLQIGDYGPICKPAGAAGISSDLMDSMGARLLPASLTDDCRLGGLIGMRP